MKKTSTDWAALLRDASLMFETIVALALALALFGVPLLSSGLGITAAGSWQSVSVAFVILAASGYVFIQIVSDLFDKGNRVLSPRLTGERWKAPLLLFLVVVLFIVLTYSKMSSSNMNA
jgi:uncharacterized membrane protein